LKNIEMDSNAFHLAEKNAVSLYYTLLFAGNSDGFLGDRGW